MKLFLTLFTLLCVLCSSHAAMAQQAPDPSKPDEQLTKDEAVIRIQLLRDQVAQLEQRLNSLNKQNSDYQQELSDIVAAIKRCEEEILSLLGITNADIESFRQRLGVLEGRTREKGRLSDKVLAEQRSEIEAMENELNGMRKEKPAMLPEFYDRIIALARDIRGLYRKPVDVSSYTVGTWAETRDCLWNISAKPQIYNDPLQWPKIWQANRPLIKNPDIIQPGWVLIIPPPGPKSSDELKAERSYHRKKRAAVRQTGATEQAGTQK